MPSQKEKGKNTTQISITKNELKNIMEQFNPDMLTDSEEIYRYKEAIQNLEKSDAIIFSLYAELASERKVAELLGVSITPIHKTLTRIKKEILEETNDNND